MHRLLSFKRLSILFLALFAVLVTATMVFQRFWVEPGDRCENRGGWYDLEGRVCATPIYIPDITHRPEGVTRAEASTAKNRELVDLESQVSARRRANQQQIEEQRAIQAEARNR